MKRSGVVWLVLVGVAICALYAGALLWAQSKADQREEEQRRDAYFAGMCAQLEGEVEGDLCVRDNQVVMRRSQVDFG